MTLKGLDNYLDIAATYSYKSSTNILNNLVTILGLIEVEIEVFFLLCSII